MSPKRSGAIAILAQYRHDKPDPEEEDGTSLPPADGAQASGDTTQVLDAITLCQSTLTSRIKEAKIGVSLI